MGAAGCVCAITSPVLPQPTQSVDSFLCSLVPACRPKRLKPVILSHPMLPGLLEARWRWRAGPGLMGGVAGRLCLQRSAA